MSNTASQTPVLIAYVPVLHAGYVRLFDNHPEATELYLFGADLIASYDHLLKDIRKLDPNLVQQAITSWHRFDTVKILDTQTIHTLQEQRRPLIVSDDEVTTALIQTYFADHEITRDTIFLRWDKIKSIEPVKVAADITLSTDALDQAFIRTAADEGLASRDWWRRIGALAAKDGAILLQAHNTYVPSEQTAYDEGDPRSNFSAGIHFESSLALHAEASIVAQAAKAGISLEGVDVYSETFPCPPCAKQLAFAGIKRLFYRTGYSVLDGERILKSQGVQIIFVP